MSEITESIMQALEKRIQEALEERSKSSTVDMNSYGAGYDTGYLDGLRWTRDLIAGAGY